MTAAGYEYETTIVWSEREIESLLALSEMWQIPAAETIRRALHSTAVAKRPPMVSVRVPRPHKRLIRLRGFDYADLRAIARRWRCSMSDAVRWSVAHALKSEAVRTLIRDGYLAQVEPPNDG